MAGLVGVTVCERLLKTWGGGGGRGGGGKEEEEEEEDAVVEEVCLTLPSLSLSLSLKGTYEVRMGKREKKNVKYWEIAYRNLQ